MGRLNADYQRSRKTEAESGEKAFGASAEQPLSGLRRGEDKR